MTLQVQRFLNHLAGRGWTVLRTTPTAPTTPTTPTATTATTATTAMPVAVPGDAQDYDAFLATFTELHNANQTRWFLSAADHDGTADSAFPWHSLRDISLEAALDDTARQAVLNFWQQHTPIYMSVAGDYEFLAIDRESGRIVHGIEPEFEDIRVVSPDLGTLFEDMIAGRSTAGLLA